MFPVNSNVPFALFAIIKEPAPDPVPLMVRILPEVLTFIVTILPVIKEKLRFVVAVLPLYNKVPPAKTISVPAPILLLAPDAPIVDTDKVPALMMVLPVYVFVPDSTRSPAPSLYNDPPPDKTPLNVKVVPEVFTEM